MPLLALATEALGGKRVLFEEFGYASSEKGDISEFQTLYRNDGTLQNQYFADDEAGGRYYREVLEKLARCGALGAFGWMFCDYHPSLWNKPPFDTCVHERFFGLTRYDGTVKPSGEAMRAFAERVATGDLPKRDIAPLTLDADAWYQDSRESFALLFREKSGKI
ncbi:hypothetical protein [Ktedonospora formicarum]|uniref:hypothetical protein n=1 Tax=Ktedonospora formicarum TaxID=2778364 RepID=UPI001C68F8F0|nr:hypothetical protein [Ktedonospora formicarum]